jgi:predicted metal-dependent peptidase
MEMLSKAVINIIRSYPFYGALLMQMDSFPDQRMKHPAGISIRNGRIEMLYNPDIFSSYTLEQATGVLEHECLHVVMRHMARQRDRNALVMFGEEVYSVWNMATDMSVNSFIETELPPTPLLPEQFGLCEGKDAEYYYDALIEVRSEDSWELPQFETILQGEGCSKRGNIDSDSSSEKDSSHEMNASLKASGMMSDSARWDDNNTNTEIPGPAEKVARQDEGCRRHTGENPDNSSGENDASETNPPLKLPGMIGDHDGWDDNNTNTETPEPVEEIIRQTVRQAIQRARQCHGKLPACIKEEVESWLRKTEIPWTSVTLY